jgi:hypothetical protein
MSDEWDTRSDREIAGLPPEQQWGESPVGTSEGQAYGSGFEAGYEAARDDWQATRDGSERGVDDWQMPTGMGPLGYDQPDWGQRDGNDQREAWGQPDGDNKELTDQREIQEARDDLMEDRQELIDEKEDLIAQQMALIEEKEKMLQEQEERLDERAEASDNKDDEEKEGEDEDDEQGGRRPRLRIPRGIRRTIDEAISQDDDAR